MLLLDAGSWHGRFARPPVDKAMIMPVEISWRTCKVIFISCEKAMIMPLEIFGDNFCKSIFSSSALEFSKKIFGHLR